MKKLILTAIILILITAACDPGVGAKLVDGQRKAAEKAEDDADN